MVLHAEGATPNPALNADSPTAALRLLIGEPVNLGVGRLESKWEHNSYAGVWELGLPEVSRFFGIIVAMYYSDHSPPHFHAKYGGDQASFRIDNGEVLQGKLGTRAMRLVEEWRVLHQAELLDDWNRAQARQPLNKIDPLE